MVGGVGGLLAVAGFAARAADDGAEGLSVSAGPSVKANLLLPVVLFALSELLSLAVVELRPPMRLRSVPVPMEPAGIKSFLLSSEA